MKEETIQRRKMSADAESNGQITFEDLGIRPTESTQQNLLLGKTRTFQSITTLEFVFFIISAISIATLAAFTLYRLSHLALSSTDSVFAIFLLVNLIFCLVYLIDGIFREQQYEILVLVCTTAIVLFYVILDYFSPGISKDDVKLIRLIVCAVLGPIVIAMGFVVAYNYWVSGNLVFRIVGASTEFQGMCKLLYLGLTLLVFDAQAMTSSLLLILEEGIQSPKQLHLIIIIVGTIFMGIWLVIGYLAMRLESVPLTWGFMCLSVVQPSYVIWKFYETANFVDSVSILHQSAFVAGVVLLVIHTILIGTMFCIYRNFGKGLKEKVYGESRSDIPSATDGEVDSNPDSTYE